MLNQLFGLDGKVALVTGGATGIGRMAATGLAGAGARVMICSRKLEMCEKTAEEINAMGLPGSVEAFRGDVGSDEGIDAIVDDVRARTDNLHILMNNAGATWGTPYPDYPYKSWEKVMGLNAQGLFHMTQRLTPMLAASATDDDPARVINVGSVMGQAPMGLGTYAYSASKAAVHHLTRILATELAGQRITVNAIAPGPFPSNMTAFATGKAETRAKIDAANPLGRVGRPDDIAGLLVFLAALSGAYITGAVIPTDGGLHVETIKTLFHTE